MRSNEIFFIFLSIFFICGNLGAREITVAKAGGDYSVIQQALNAASPGDVILVRSGVYHEKITIPSSGNGTSGYITLRGYPDESVCLDGEGVSGKHMVYMKDKNYIKIIGLEIRNNLNVNDGSGIRIEGSGTNIEIRDCKIHNIRGQDAMGITVYGTRSTAISNLVIEENEVYDCDAAESEAITLNGNITGFSVSRNIVHDINNIAIDFIGGESWTGNYGVARNGKCSGNTVYRARSSYGGGYAAGIYVDGGKDITIEYNVVHECDLGMEIGAENASYSATGIIVRSNLIYNNDKAGIVFGGYEESAGRTSYCYFYNNTLYKNDSLHDGNGEFWIQYASHNIVKNNMVYSNSQNLMVASDEGNTDNTLDYNLWYTESGESSAAFNWNGAEYTGFSAYRAATGKDAHSLFKNPRFLNAGGSNFHIHPDSPAVDAGDPSYSPGTNVMDRDGQERVIHGRVDMGADELGLPTLISPNGGETWVSGTTVTIRWESLEPLSTVSLRYSTDNGAHWTSIVDSTSNTGSYSWVVPGAVSSSCLVSVAYSLNSGFMDTSDAVFSILSGNGGPVIGLSADQFIFGAAGNFHSNARALTITNTGGGTLNWQVSATVSWLTCSPTSGTGTGVITVTPNGTGLTPGSYTGSISVSATGASNSPQVIPVTLKVYASTNSPIGSFDSPADGVTGITGSIAVTGWVLDDIGVESVKIYRQENGGMVYIGDGVCIENARPDVEGLFPDYPDNSNAGWGYMLLTHFLPGGGNGSYTLVAVAEDNEGKTSVLGYKTITCDHAHGVKPFGALDTPLQGGVATGSEFVNWGWVLTPMPNQIAGDGSGIDVWVDSVQLGHPVYNIYRSDISSLFPGYANSSGAAGYFYLDTRGYANGLHTICWSACDSGGNTDGIGSRFFTIRNDTQPAAPNGRMQRRKWETGREISSVKVMKGFQENGEWMDVYPDRDGVIAIEVRVLERIAVMVADDFGEGVIQGYMIVDGKQRELPVGSMLDARSGIFHWIPGPGFLGDYELAFISDGGHSGKPTQAIRLRLRVLPAQ